MLHRTIIAGIILAVVAWPLAGGCRKSKRKLFLPISFAVTSVNPADNASGVGLKPVITIYFTAPAKAATINGASIIIEQSGGGAVNGSFYFTDSSATAVFLPDNSLLASTSYTITFTNSVMSATGAALKTAAFANPVTFTTTSASDSTAPTFAGVEGIALSFGGVKLMWSAATDNLAASGEISYAVYRAASSGGQSFVKPYAVTPPGRLYFIDPDWAGMWYYVVRARDTFGNMDANVVEVCTNDIGQPVSFAADLLPILQTTCAVPGCHEGSLPTGNLYLSAYTSPFPTKDISDEVVPGAPDASNLIWRIEGTIPPRMPLVGSALSAARIQLFRNWIAQGALDN